ncbi:MAG: hypothetical protein WC789_00915 [Lentisphaeria bacterium]|jgi:uroporphyrinogen-III decarboxylase
MAPPGRRGISPDPGAAAGGGYIFAASHTIQPDTPLANVLALSKAVQAR